MKEESGGKKVDPSFERFICEREILYLIISLIMSQWSDSWIGVMWWNLGFWWQHEQQSSGQIEDDSFELQVDYV